jgi:uncharacterized repeat protein (TIGR03803 family)
MKKLLLLLAIAFCGIANAQYSLLIDFAGNTGFTGKNPNESLISDGTFLYGMTYYGGANNMGTIFKVKPDGTGLVQLLSFTGTATGRLPGASLFYDGTFLYGMTLYGGTNDMGIIFKIMPDGTGFVKLLDFAGTTNGSNPFGSLISDGTFLYGVTRSGGTAGSGTIFKIMPDGTGYVKLYNFNGGSNGGNPSGTLFYDGTFLYGTANTGGTANMGTIFKIMPNGTGFAKLLNFTGVANGSAATCTLISDGTFLYGMSYYGGANNLGTLFKIMPDGTGYVKLLDFDGTANGGNPKGSLIYDGTYLYGLTGIGGTNNIGTIFKILPDGTGFAKLLDFTGAANGSRPFGSLISDGTFFYGMTYLGGTNNLGTIFKILPDGTGFVTLLNCRGAANGSKPTGTLISDGTFFYGMTGQGGTNNLGTIFKIMPDGTGYEILLDFAGAVNGNTPTGSLIFDGTFLYGMTNQGGTNNLGTIFKIMPDGTGYVKLLDFAGAINGSDPLGSLYADGTFLYGMTSTGGIYNLGTLFKIMPDGTGYVKLLDFSGTTNGSTPTGSLISDGTFLYGMTKQGGTNNNAGTLFKIMPDGTGYLKLLDFEDIANGSNPYGSLISDGTFLYGMIQFGGINNSGTLFKIMPDGTGFVKLLDFAGTANGRYPAGSLITDGTFLYGMTQYGGTNSLGTLFKIMPDGTGYVKLLDFTGAANGSHPNGSLISDGTSFYGMTSDGGSPNAGTVFKFGLATGINENDNTSISVSIYPNPFTNEIKINSSSSGEIILFDINGKEILRQNSLTGETTISTENISAGFYLLNYHDKGKTVNRKLVKF